MKTRRHLAIALCTVAALTLVSPGARAAIDGVYSSPLGALSLEERAGVVRGRATSTTPCGQKKGTVLLEGSRLDDSITGTISVCKVGKGCAGKAEGIVMLLVTRDGDVLSGALHVDAGKCKTVVSGDGLSLRRQKAGARDGATRGAVASADATEATSTPSDGAKPAERAAKGNEGRTEKGVGTARGKEPATTETAARAGDPKRPSGEGARTRDDRGTVPAPTPSTTSGDATSSASADASTADKVPPVARGDRQRAMQLATEGVALLQADKMEDARVLFEQATEVDPSYEAGWNLIGITYAKRDRFEEALEMYKRSLEANPAYPDPYYNMACMYARTGEKEKAFAYLQIALLNGYVDVNTIASDPDLQSLEGDERFAKLKVGDFFY